ncbi:MAG: phosphoribosylpyrophosphate synthetase [Chryseosolibacter sp.]
MKNYNSLSDALNDLIKRGYTEDFELKPHCIECASLNLELEPEKFVVDEFYRFEGMSDPDDNSIVFAISSQDGVKGTLVDAYGVYSENLTEPMIRKLAFRR